MSGHFTLKLLREFLAPLQVPLYLIVLWGIWKLRRKPFSIHQALSTTAGMWSGMFISIASITMKLFIGMSMPNGKQMVRSIPELELFKQDWISICPMALLVLFIYSVGFIAYIMHAVWTAPRGAASSPAFWIQYRLHGRGHVIARSWTCHHAVVDV